MSRAQRLAIITALLSILYLLLYLRILTVPFINDKVIEEVLPVIPWWLLVSFGSYSLWSLGWGLMTFRDCTEAYDELMAEISMAKNDLRVKGVMVD